MTTNIKNDVILGVIREMAWTKQLNLSDIDIYVYELSKIYDKNNTPIKQIVTIDNLITIIKELPLFKKFFQSGGLFPYPLTHEYKIKYIEKDGNCLFHCLRYLDLWKSYTHQEIRTIICSYLREMISHLEIIYMDETNPSEDLFTLLQENKVVDVSKYITVMCAPSEWGTYIEILTAIYITKQNINVYHDYEGFGQLHPYFEITKQYLCEKNIIIIDYDLPTINLYNNTKHYEILMPINFDKDKLNDEPEDIRDILIYTQSLLEDLHKISSKPKTQYICIPNPNGNFSSQIKCYADSKDFKFKYLKYKMKYLNLKLQKSS